MLNLYDLAIDYVQKPTIVRCHMPKISWKLKSDKTNVMQTAYQIVFKGCDGSFFDSGKIEDSSVVGHTISGMVLSSRTEYEVQVTVWDSTGDCATLTETFVTEILPEEWGNAKWIRPAEHIVGWAPYLRTKFETTKVKRAVLYASGLGYAEVFVNGHRTDDSYVEMPLSNYEKMIFYRRWDVTNRIVEGGNAIAIWLGQGFYAQDRVWEEFGFGLAYGKECAIVRLELTLEDGTTQAIVSDTEHWKAKYSPITLNNVYAGETYDCRLETPDFADYAGSEIGWMQVVEDETPKGELMACLIPPVREIRRLPAISVHGASGEKDGAWVFDFGENIAGVPEFSLPHSPRGAMYVFRYGETLNEQGGVDLRSTGAYATQCIPQDIYICRGDEEGEVYRPHFSYHGFRYIEISGIVDCSEGYGTTPKLDLVCALQLSTDFKKTGDFSCDHKDWNRFYQIMDNTYRSNYHGFPEDCPVREKCGWLGDAHIVSDYGLLTYDSTASYIKYMQDIRTTREVYDGCRMIAPGRRRSDFASPLWGCAQIILPYKIWKYTGDEDIIREHFDLMEEWVIHELDRSEDYIISVGLGDWDPAGGNENPRRMPVQHSSTFIFYEISHIMEELCYTFGMGDAKYYAELSKNIKRSIQEKFYDKEKYTYGFLGSDAVAKLLDLVPEQDIENHEKQLLQGLQDSGYEMPTGIYGNKYLTTTMLESGFGSEVGNVLFGRNHDSFGTMMDEGATTIWECPSMHAVEPHFAGEISSYNHPMHGGFLYTCYTHLAGIRPFTPGFADILFAPCFVNEIENVSAKVDTPYGIISVNISKEDEKYVCNISVPAGARMHLQNKENFIIQMEQENTKGNVILGSGTYKIEYCKLVR